MEDHGPFQTNAIRARESDILAVVQDSNYAVFLLGRYRVRLEDHRLPYQTHWAASQW